ncbi:MAG TPA: HAD hydrolase family protein [Bryobacteraceae bacterium]|nr:HAD hydrolase family protein [Bryobacteraceae bacterium]
MKFLVLAIDFDGTIATNDVLNPEVRAALGELRRRGIIVILVTGRILDDLRQVCGDLHFLDAVVGENGAAIEFPDTGYSMTLAPPPSEALLAELRSAGIEHKHGHAVIEASATDGSAILALLQRLELPLTLMFNRGRVMVLPQAVTKATGLEYALTILRLSPHNALGIGDAENDHELLRLCEVGVAVNWGSEALKRAADHVLPGDGPAAVAKYLIDLAARGFLPIPIAARRRLLLGHTDSGEPLALAVRGRNVLVAGEPKSGKSWVAGLLCEQLILYGYSVCVLDPEGDYTSLEALPGVTVMGGRDPLPRPRDLVRALRHSDVSIVIDLSHTEHREKLEYVRSVLPALAMLRRRTGLPHRIVLDEAHYFLQDPESRRLLDLELSGYTFVTYRASALCPESLRASQAILVTRESDPAEIQTLKSFCTCTARTEAEWVNMFRDLVIGEAAALPVTEEAQGDVRRIHLAPRLTPHVRHLAKYVDIPIEDSRAFIFWTDTGQTGQRARTLGELADVLDHVPARRFDGHLLRKDFSHWIVGVFGDHQLAAEVSRIEDRYRESSTREATEEIVREIQSRYDLTPFSARDGSLQPVA